jgi:4-hydroxybenzoate polyprenyltransferase
VPRGLVSVRELLALAIVVGLAGGALATSLGATAVACYALAAGTIWLLGTDRRRHAAGRYPRLRDALAHSAIAPLLILCAWASVAEIRPLPALAAALLLAWGASLAMEVSRKTVLPAEERDGVPTYSAELGRARALLVAALAIAAALAGAAWLDAAVRGLPGTAVVPLAAAAAAPLAVTRFGQRMGTGFVGTAAAALVLVALLWPVVVMLELG